MSTEINFSGKILPTKQVSKLRRFLPQIVATSVKNVLLLVYGMTMGMPTMLIPNLTGDVPGESIILGEDGISWVGSLNYLSNPIGCVLSGIATKPMGRKRSMQTMSLLFVAAFLFFHFASEAWHIFLALFLNGFAGGLLEAPTLMYTVETSEPSLRGALSSTSTLAIVIGMIMSFILGTVFTWRKMALINACITLAGLVLLFLIPESPYWLILKGRKEEAKKNLAWLRGWTQVESVEKEFSSICCELKRLDSNGNNKESKTNLFDLNTIKLYMKATFVKPYLLICIIFILAHFGVTPINVYAVKIFQILMIPINSYYATIMIGTTELIGCILLLVLVRFLGKRILTFISLTGVFISFLFAGIYTYYIGVNSFETTNYIDEQIADKFNWVPLVTILSMGFFSYLMIYTLPWIIMGEIYPNDVRDTGSGLSAATAYVIGFLANKTFFDLVNVITLPGVFWLYSGTALVGLVLMYFLLPETEGKSLAEIAGHYSGKRKLTNRVYKGNNIDGVINKGFSSAELGDLDSGRHHNLTNL